MTIEPANARGTRSRPVPSIFESLTETTVKTSKVSMMCAARGLISTGIFWQGNGSALLA